jgi:hypothetical protein
MAWRKPPDGLLPKVEHAAGTMRHIATRLREISDRLPKDTSEELKFLAQLLSTEAESISVHAASGDLVSTGLAAKMAKAGIATTISIVSMFGGAIIEASGQHVFDQIVGIHDAATDELSEIQALILNVGTQQVDGDIEALQSGLATFAETLH